jgi:putative restriction endonuclease
MISPTLAEMRLFVALTDRDWYLHLAAHPKLGEVNFWRPQAKAAFHALQLGEPMLFKLHSPERAICGVGWFEGFTLLPVFLAWRTFGPGNGAATYHDFLARLRRLRRGATVSDQEELGCLMLRQPTMFTPHDWIPEPMDWAPNIVQGKGYNTESEVEEHLWGQVRERLAATGARAGEFAEGLPVQFAQGLAWHRLGQGAFQALVTEAYQRRCAFSRERVLPALEACHIRPAASGGSNDISNGLLLRADIHSLFDAGYVGVHPSTLILQVSSHLQQDYQNGHEYREMQGRELWCPSSRSERPSAVQLEWHADTVFRT